MLVRENAPEEFKDIFDDCAVELIAKLARKYALNEGIVELKDIVANMSNDELNKLPERLKRHSDMECYVADVMFDAMVECVRYGARKQEAYTYEHFSKMLQSCVGKGS